MLHDIDTSRLALSLWEDDEDDVDAGEREPDATEMKKGAFDIPPPPPGSTLAQRVQWLLDRMDISARELSRRANLKSQTHVTAVLKGGSALVKTVAAIAEASDVSFVWLSLGHGTPDKSGPANDLSATEDFPNELRSAIGGRTLHPMTLAALRAAPKSGGDALYWLYLIDQLELLSRRHEGWLMAAAVPSPAPHDEPSGARRPKR